MLAKIDKICPLPRISGNWHSIFWGNVIFQGNINHQLNFEFSRKKLKNFFVNNFSVEYFFQRKSWKNLNFFESLSSKKLLRISNINSFVELGIWKKILWFEWIIWHKNFTWPRNIFEKKLDPENLAETSLTG